MSRRRRPLWARRPGTASAFRGLVAGPVHAPELWWRRRETQVRPGRCGLARRLGIITPVELVNKDPRYSKVHLIDPAPLAVEVWDYLAGWYEAETGLDNSTLLEPLEGEQSDYVLINHSRWDGNLLLFMARQLPEKFFRSYMLANLKAHHLAAMPVLYRLA
jgi:hypothetical protein